MAEVLVSTVLHWDRAVTWNTSTMALQTIRDHLRSGGRVGEAGEMAKHDDKSQYDGAKDKQSIDPSKIQKPKDDGGKHSDGKKK